MKYEVFLEAAVNLFEVNFFKYMERLEIDTTMAHAKLEKDTYQRRKENIWQKQV